MDPAALPTSGATATAATAAAALRSTITEETLREVLREAALGKRTAVAKKDEQLELCAKLLRQRILADFIKRKTEQQQLQQPCSTRPGEEQSPRNTTEGPCEHEGQPITLSVCLRDEAREPLPMRRAELRFDGCKSHCEAKLSCPHCRRPVDFATQFCRKRGDADDAGDGPTASTSSSACCSPRATDLPKDHEDPQPKDIRPNAYCLVLLDGSDVSFQQSLVLGQALRATGSKTKRILLHAATIPASFLTCLRLCWDEVRVLEKGAALWHRYIDNATAAKLSVLELVEFSKVLLLEREVLPVASLDPLFELPTPASFFTKGSLETDPGLQARQPGIKVPQLERGLILLSPSKSTFAQMVRELGESPGAAWPPKLLPTTHLSEKQLPEEGATTKGTWNRTARRQKDEETRDYLVRFYLAFGPGRWMRLPEFYRPVPGDIADDTCPILWCKQPQGMQWIEAMEAPPKRLLDFQRDFRTAAVCLARVFKDNPSIGIAEIGPCTSRRNLQLQHMLRQVQRLRCSNCYVYDEGGATDPINNRWFCRFCQEANVFQPETVSFVPALLGEESRALRESLGPWFLEARSQRWYGLSTDWNNQSPDSWIEIRPHGVLRIWENGYASIGGWKIKFGDGYRELVLQIPRRDRSEVWHTFRESKWSSAKTPLLEEVSREAVRSLGAARLSVDKPLFCRGVSSLTDSRQVSAAPTPSTLRPTEETAGSTRAVEGDNDDCETQHRSTRNLDCCDLCNSNECVRQSNDESTKRPPPPQRDPPKCTSSEYGKESIGSISNNNNNNNNAQSTNHKTTTTTTTTTTADLLGKRAEARPPPPSKPAPQQVASEEAASAKEKLLEATATAAVAAATVPTRRPPPPSRAVPAVPAVDQEQQAADSSNNKEEMEVNSTGNNTTGAGNATNAPPIAAKPTIPPPPRRAPPPVNNSNDNNSNIKDPTKHDEGVNVQQEVPNHATRPPPPSRPCPPGPGNS